MDWQAAEEIARYWEKPLVLKGIMSVADARRAIDIGAAAIMISNHGGRQLDGSRAPFDQLSEIVDAVGDRIDVICDGEYKEVHTFLKPCRWVPKPAQVVACIFMLWQQPEGLALKRRWGICAVKWNGI